MEQMLMREIVFTRLHGSSLETRVDIFFAHSVLVKLALRQAAQLSLFIWKVNKRCTFTWDLIKEAPLIDRKRKMPCTQRNQTQSVGT